MRRPLALVAVAALAAATRAQTPTVDPAAFAWVAASQETGFPFGRPDRRVVRHLEVHDGLRGVPRTIGGVALRRSPLDSQPVPAFWAEVSMRLSTARTTAATVAATFAQNVGIDAVTVLPRRRVSFAASPGVTTSPAPFEYVLPADVPFAFGGAGPLCIDWTVHDHVNATAMRFDLHAEGHAHVGDLGPGCGALQLGTQVGTPDVVHTVTGAAPLAPVALLLGSAFDQTAGLPLPLDLGAIGAPGCFLRLDPILDVRGLADASGRFAVTIPAAPVVPDAFYGAQALAVAPGANPLGLALSNTALTVPITGRTVGRVWSEDLAATTGVRQPVFGLVVEVR